MNKMTQNSIILDRKVLSELAVSEPIAFAEIVKASTK